MSSLQYLSPLFYHGLAFCQIPTMQCNGDFDGGGDYDENGDDENYDGDDENEGGGDDTLLPRPRLLSDPCTVDWYLMILMVGVDDDENEGDGGGNDTLQPWVCLLLDPFSDGGDDDYGDGDHLWEVGFPPCLDPSYMLWLVSSKMVLCVKIN